MGCACSAKGGKVWLINSAFLKGDTTSYEYLTCFYIEVIIFRFKFVKIFVDRINRKLLDGTVPDSLVSTGADSRY